MPEVISQKTDIIRTIIAESPISQSIDAVSALLAALHRETGKLPLNVLLPGHKIVLRLSSKKDCNYVVTADDCSCPARTYHPEKRCKHMKLLFATDEEKAEEHAKIDIALRECRERQHEAIKAAALRELKVRGNMKTPKTLLEEMYEQGYERAFEPAE